MVNCQCNSCRATCQSRKWIFRVFVFQAIFVVGEPLCDLKPPFWVLNNFTRDNFMKIEWFITEVTAVGPPIRAQTDFFGHFWCFLAKLCCFCGQSATLWSGHPLLSPKDLMFGHFVKIELYITDVHNSYRVPHQSRAWFFWLFLMILGQVAVGYPARDEVIFLSDFGRFATNSRHFLSPGSHFVI